MKKTIAMAALTTILVTGCARQVHYVNGNTMSGHVHTTDQTFFISGLGQTKTTNAANVCGGASRVVAVETIASPLNVILGIVTFGIYTPRDQTVYCK